MLRRPRRSSFSAIVVLTGMLAACGDGASTLELQKDAGDPPPRDRPRDAGSETDSGSTLPPPPDTGRPDAGPPRPLPDAGPPRPIPVDAGPDEDAGEPIPTCGGAICGLHGDCVMDAMGVPGCVCDQGYTVQAGAGDDGVCVEDTSCIKARILSCRWNGGSAIHTHFSLSYCSGNPYLGLDVADLILDEKGGADFEELLPSESFATIIPHEVTAHIYVVVDVSNSIQQSDVLDEIGTGVQTLLDRLEVQGGDYRFAMFLFDGKPYLYEFIADTSDLGAARTALDQLATQVRSDPSSSNVYGAVIDGIHELDRARTLRELVSQHGLLTTGTLILISDGDDRANTRSFADAQAAVTETVSNVITVGLGDVANFPRLTSIGRDGSYSAQEPALVAAAFDQIAERIGLVEQSLYFTGYCTPKRAGLFETRIGVEGFDFARPTCTFQADGFVAGCSAATFDQTQVCTGRECGGPGCGECAAGTCCSGGLCVAPDLRDDGQLCSHEWMCGPDLTCAGNACTPTLDVGVACSTGPCDPGEGYCGLPNPPPDPAPPLSCQAARADGEACTAAAECRSLHCDVDPDRPTAITRFCLPEAKMFFPCAGGTPCEPGSYCAGASCKPQITGGACTTNQQCMSGTCVALPSGVSVCGSYGGACLFTHDL